MPKSKQKQTGMPIPEFSLLDLPTKGRPDNWICAVWLIELHAKTISMLGGPEATNQNIWDLLDVADSTHTYRNRLDRSKFDGTPKERMQELWNLYFAALMTGMVERAGLLEAYKSTELVVFQIAPGQKRHALTAESENYTTNLPALAPLEGDIPSINCEYLENLQERIEAILALKGILPAEKGRKPDPKLRADIMIDKLGFERLFIETKAAAAEYLEAHLSGNDRDNAPAMVDSGVPFIFMWHVLLGHYEMIIDKLLRGTGMVFIPTQSPGRRGKETVGASMIGGVRKSKGRNRNN